MSSEIFNLVPTIATVAIAERILEPRARGLPTRQSRRKMHHRSCSGTHCAICKKCMTNADARRDRTPLCIECRKQRERDNKEDFNEVVKTRAERRVRSR
jgi:hypothetical protein